MTHHAKQPNRLKVLFQRLVSLLLRRPNHNDESRPDQNRGEPLISGKEFGHPTFEEWLSALSCNPRLLESEARTPHERIRYRTALSLWILSGRPYQGEWPDGRWTVKSWTDKWVDVWCSCKLWANAKDEGRAVSGSLETKERNQ